MQTPNHYPEQFDTDEPEQDAYDQDSWAYEDALATIRRLGREREAVIELQQPRSELLTVANRFPVLVEGEIAF